MTFKTLQSKEIQEYIATNMKEMGFDSVEYNTSETGSVYLTFYNKKTVTYVDKKFYVGVAQVPKKELVAKGLIYVVRFSTHGKSGKIKYEGVSLQIVEFVNGHNVHSCSITDFIERDKNNRPSTFTKRIA